MERKTTNSYETQRRCYNYGLTRFMSGKSQEQMKGKLVFQAWITSDSKRVSESLIERFKTEVDRK